MEPRMKDHRKFNTNLFFQIEQWLAFLVGIVCLTVYGWSVLEGKKAFSTGWLLMIAIAMFGVALTRFAFYGHFELRPDAKTPTVRDRRTYRGLNKNSSRLILISSRKRRP